MTEFVTHFLPVTFLHLDRFRSSKYVQFRHNASRALSEIWSNRARDSTCNCLREYAIWKIQSSVILEHENNCSSLRSGHCDSVWMTAESVMAEHRVKLRDSKPDKITGNWVESQTKRKFFIEQSQSEKVSSLNFKKIDTKKKCLFLLNRTLVYLVLCQWHCCNLTSWVFSIFAFWERIQSSHFLQSWNTERSSVLPDQDLTMSSIRIENFSKFLTYIRNRLQRCATDIRSRSKSY